MVGNLSVTAENVNHHMRCGRAIPGSEGVHCRAKWGKENSSMRCCLSGGRGCPNGRVLPGIRGLFSQK